MLIFLFLLCCSATIGAAQMNATQYTLTRKRELSGNILSLHTTLIHNKTQSKVYHQERFTCEGIDDNTIQLGHWCGGGGGTSLRDFLDKDTLQRVFKKAREKYLKESAEYHYEEKIKALGEPSKEFHFNRTDLPDEPASPLETQCEQKAEADENKNNPAEELNSSAATNSLWGWCTIL
jgi:hypothetical protein